MPLELEAAPGGADSNSYPTVAEAVAHASYRVGGEAFLDLEEDEQIQTLVTATMDIDTLEASPGLLGSRYSATQALAFPRGSATLPRDLVRATIELAMSYARSAGDVLVTQGNGNIKEDTVGPLTTVYFESGKVSATAVERFPGVVQRLLHPFISWPADSGGWGGSAVVERGS